MRRKCWTTSRYLSAQAIGGGQGQRYQRRPAQALSTVIQSAQERRCTELKVLI